MFEIIFSRAGFPLKISLSHSLFMLRGTFSLSQNFRREFLKRGSKIFRVISILLTLSVCVLSLENFIENRIKMYATMSYVAL